MKPIDAGALKDNLTDIYGNENRLVCLKDVLDLIGEQPDVVRPKEMMSCEWIFTVRCGTPLPPMWWR